MPRIELESYDNHYNTKADQRHNYVSFFSKQKDYWDIVSQQETFIITSVTTYTKESVEIPPGLAPSLRP